jgi:alkylmercury lyase
MSNVNAVKEVWESWEKNISQVEQQISRVGFRLLLEGESVPASRLAEVLGWDEKKVINELERMAGQGRCTLDASGVLTGMKGLSVVKSTQAPHQLQMIGKTFYTWCALDAVGIPAALGVEAFVKSRTIDSGADIGLHYRNNHWEPENVWINFIDPAQGTRLAGGTCSKINFYGSVDSNVPGVLMPLNEAASLGKLVWG